MNLTKITVSSKIVLQFITFYYNKKFKNMRQVINISLPLPLSTVVNDEVKSGRFATKSEFFRNLLRLWLEGKLVYELGESRKELKAGKGKLLKSLKDLR